MKPSSLIEVRNVSNRGRGGRGVFALVDMLPNRIIETAPCIVMPPNEIFPKGFTKRTTQGKTLSWYVFGAPEGMLAVALGYASLYNHSFEPNAQYDFLEDDIITITAIKPIKAGEEIFINYNGDPEDKRSVEFEVQA